MCVNLEEKLKLENLETKFLGRQVSHFESIDSTQLEIFRNIEEKSITNGKLVLADIQYEGKRYTW